MTKFCSLTVTHFGAGVRKKVERAQAKEKAAWSKSNWSFVEELVVRGSVVVEVDVTLACVELAVVKSA